MCVHDWLRLAEVNEGFRLVVDVTKQSIRILARFSRVIGDGEGSVGQCIEGGCFRIDDVWHSTSTSCQCLTMATDGGAAPTA